MVIQFNFGFYEFAALANLIDALKNAGVVVLVVFHSTADRRLPERRWKIFGRCWHAVTGFGAQPSDLNRLKTIGLAS